MTEAEISAILAKADITEEEYLALGRHVLDQIFARPSTHNPKAPECVLMDKLESRFSSAHSILEKEYNDRKFIRSVAEWMNEAEM